jgi:hypothetical protein
MMEVALVFNIFGEAIWYHNPREGGTYIPDSSDLWEILWKNRVVLGGVAHTHPWDGPAHPSHTDVTTFSAIEIGLGKKLLWPIVTFTEVVYFVKNPLINDYVPTKNYFNETPWWGTNIGKLRQMSRGE